MLRRQFGGLFVSAAYMGKTCSRETLKGFKYSLSLTLSFSLFSLFLCPSVSVSFSVSLYLFLSLRLCKHRGKETHRLSSHPSFQSFLEDLGFPVSSCLICWGGNNRPQDVFWSLLADHTRRHRFICTFTSHSIETQIQAHLKYRNLLKSHNARALQKGQRLDSSVCSGQQVTSCFANRGFKGPILKIPKSPYFDPLQTRISEILGLDWIGLNHRNA